MSELPKETHHQETSDEEGNRNYLTRKAHDIESNRPKKKSSHKRKPFVCPVAIFDEKEDPNKKCMYPKHLVYADEKDTQLEEIRAMHYWKKVKGPELKFASRPKTTHDAFTQTGPEPNKIARMTEASTQTDPSISVPNEEFVAPAKSTITKSNVEFVAPVKSTIKKEKPKKLTSRDIETENAVPRIGTRSLTRAKLTTRIPAISNLAKTAIKEESPILPISSLGSMNSNATFVVSKGKSKDEKVDLHPFDHNDEQYDNDEIDDTVNTKVFKVTAASTPFQNMNKNKSQKERRKAMKIESPISDW